MPKLKTHKGAAKRLSVTGSGKIMRAKGHKSHLRRNKTPRTKRLFDEMTQVAKSDEKRLKQLLPYGAK